MSIVRSKNRKQFFRRVRALLRLILLGPIAGMMAACGLRFAIISNPNRIGHLAAEVDCFLKERSLGLVPPVNPVLLIPQKKAGNSALLDIYKEHLTVWEKSWQRVLFSQFCRFDMLRLPLSRPVVAIDESASYSQIMALWEDRAPIIKLPQPFLDEGYRLLKQMGLPDGVWFVPLHVREAGYSPVDDNMHSHRNADIATYDIAIDEIIARGGWVIRMGDPSMTPMRTRAGLIDYARSSFKADKMDIWLCAHAHFFLGSSSGLAVVAGMFNRPAALTNMIPLGACYGMSPRDVSIAKKMIKHDGGSISFEKMFSSGLSRQRYAWLFEEHEITIKNNTPEEIRDVTLEMLARHDGTFASTKEDETLQLRFRALLRPGDYSYGSTARMGRNWLRTHAHLLDDTN